MRMKKLWPVGIILIALVVLWGTGLARRDVSMDMLEMNVLRFFREGLQNYDVSKGDEHGVLNDGPGFTLPAGHYKLKMTVSSDGDNTIRILTGDSVKEELLVPAQSWTNTLHFDLPEDTRDVKFLIDFQEGQHLQFHELSLVLADRTDLAWVLTLLTLLGCLLYALHVQEILNRQGFGRLLLMAAAIGFASIPVLWEGIYAGHDTLFHQMRLYNVADALSCGQFPVRMGGYGYNGYGSAASIFYPDIFLLLPGFMMCTGATVQCAMRVYIITMNAVTAATMYLCGRRIFRDETAGVCASILYTLASYRLVDLYVRDALGEYTAMAMLPLFVLGLWEVVFGDAKRWRTLVLGAVLVFMSHMLTTVLCAVLAGVVGVLGIGKILREKRLTAILKAMAATVLLCAFLLVPMLDYSMQGIGGSSLPVSCKKHAMRVTELFVTREDAYLGLGIMLVAGLAVLLYAAVTGCGEREKMHSALLLALMGVAAAFCATTLFPWGFIENLTRGMSNYLQFPYRLIAFASVFLALAGGYGMVCMVKGEAHREMAMLLTLILCMMSVYTRMGEYAVQDEQRPGQDIFFTDPYVLYRSYSDRMYLEYTMPGSDLKATTDRSIGIEGAAELTDYRRQGTIMTAQVSAQTDAQLTLPVFGFDGYRATLDGKALETGLGENNRLTVLLPAGAQGSLRVWFADKPVWRAAEAVSLVTLLALVLLRGRKGAAKHRKLLQK